MQNTEYIKQLRDILSISQKVSKIEETSNNYDESGVQIINDVPTITTEFCEIGSYGNVCYFTIIMGSKLFTRELFDELSQINDIKIYGYKNFTDNYYPKDNFSYDIFINQVLSDELVQVQFNFDILAVNPHQVSKSYNQIMEIFNNSNVKVSNQLLNILSI